MDFLELKANKADTVRKYFARIRETETFRRYENDAATLIARVWRGYFARKYISYLSDQATQVQRVWRGYKGRHRAFERRSDRIRQIENEYYNTMATQIQRVARGWLSRRHKEDFYKRKAFIAHVTRKGQEMVNMMESAYQEQIQRDRDSQRVNAIKEFSNLTENMHHLMSTKAIPGVFSSRWGDEYKTKAFGINLEDHIDGSFKNYQRKKAIEKEMRLNQRQQRILLQQVQTQTRTDQMTLEATQRQEAGLVQTQVAQPQPQLQPQPQVQAQGQPSSYSNTQSSLARSKHLTPSPPRSQHPPGYTQRFAPGVGFRQSRFLKSGTGIISSGGAPIARERARRIQEAAVRGNGGVEMNGRNRRTSKSRRKTRNLDAKTRKLRSGHSASQVNLFEKGQTSVKGGISRLPGDKRGPQVGGALLPSLPPSQYDKAKQATDIGNLGRKLQTKPIRTARLSGGLKQVALNISCRNLPKGDVDSDSDPIVVLSYRPSARSSSEDKTPLRWQHLDQTETIDDQHNPDFRRRIYVDKAIVDAEADIRVAVYDVDDGMWGDDDLLGSAVINARMIKPYLLGPNTTTAPTPRTVMLQDREGNDCKGTEGRPSMVILSILPVLSFPTQLSLRSLPNVDDDSYSDPIVRAYIKAPNPLIPADSPFAWTFAGSTEEILNDLDPDFQKPIWLDYIPGLSAHYHVKFEVYDIEESGNYDDEKMLGTAVVSLREYLDRSSQEFQIYLMTERGRPVRGKGGARSVLIMQDWVDSEQTSIEKLDLANHQIKSYEDQTIRQMQNSLTSDLR